MIGVVLFSVLLYSGTVSLSSLSMPPRPSASANYYAYLRCGNITAALTNAQSLKKSTAFNDCAATLKVFDERRKKLEISYSVGGEYEPFNFSADEVESVRFEHVVAEAQRRILRESENEYCCKKGRYRC